MMTKDKKVMAKMVMFGVMENGNFEFTDMSEEEKEQITGYRHILYQSISEVRMGAMKFALIPLDLLIPNEKYQRVYTIDYEKIDVLASNWDGDLAGVITIAVIPETEMYEVVDGWHRVLAAKMKGITHLPARIIDLPEDENERIIKCAEIFTRQGTDPLSKADRFNAEVLKGTREYVIVNNAIKGKKYLISKRIIDNERNPEKKKEYMADYSVITGLSGMLELACTEAGEVVVPQVFDILEKANWTHKRLGMSGDIIRAIGKIMNIHNNDPEYALAIARFLSNYEPQIFQANATAMFNMRKRLERQMMYLEIQVSNMIGVEPVYVGGNIRNYK